MHKARCIRRILLALILVNLAFFAYISNINLQLVGNFGSSTDDEDIEKTITIILFDFEHFENDIVETAESFRKIFPKIKIIVVSDNLPYPPLKLQGLQVKVVVQNIQPNQPSKEGRPEEFIKTKYALFIPDGFLLKKPKELNHMLKVLEDNEDNFRIIAVGADGHSYQKPLCENQIFNLRRWTLKYSANQNKAQKGVRICDSVTGEIAVLIRTKYLLQLSAPFPRPFLKGLFIQSALRKWKVGFVKNRLPFMKNKLLFQDQHNRWKHDTNRRRQVEELYERFGVKKVEKKDGVVEWHGCDKNSPRCFGTIIDDVPAFIHDGRWTPPCCLRNLRQTARYVFEIFDSHKIPYWLEGGSLLGAARHGDIIPWDYDVDIGMYKNDIEKLPQLQSASIGEQVSDPQGFVWQKSREGDFYRVQYSNINHMHVDIFPFYEKNGIMTKDTWFKTHRQDTEFPSHYLRPLERMKFIDMKVLVPNNYKDFLEFKFGKGVIENPRYPNSGKVERER